MKAIRFISLAQIHKIKLVKKISSDLSKYYIANKCTQVTLKITTRVTEKFIRELNRSIKYYGNTLTANASRASSGEDENPVYPVEK